MRLGVVVGIGVTLLLAPGAAAHLERSSYWPNPAPDLGVDPPAGGAVPAARSLRSALVTEPPGRTRVVCKPDSLRRSLTSIRRARSRGHRVRPSEPPRRLGPRSARSRIQLAGRLFRRCRFRHIQEAVFRSANNDRVVVMPGVYREEPSRAQPTNDPRCAHLRESSDLGDGAASYRYQAACPNDQSLIYVQGRAVSDVPPPQPAREDRRGIPDEGPCVRCNLQIEGSGVIPQDVLIDAAEDRAAPLRALAKPVKDVVMRADRADGIVIRNLTTAHAREVGVYVHETDGYLIDDFAAYYSGLYGVLNFTTDHGLVSDCELMGHRDSGVYPGGAPETAPVRLNQAITRCDLHHNAAGYSASMGNGVHIKGNDIYDNVTGIFTASTFPGGHPGYPQDSALIEDNSIHSNNFNAYAPESDVKPVIAMPIGVGLLVVGGNDNVVRGNRIWNNWRRGTMLVNLPDAIADGVTPGVSRPPGVYGATSHRNRHFQNKMGIAPDGRRAPNGVDFWWDEPPGEEGNCWYLNGTVTSDPFLLPADCSNISVGATYAVHAAELLPCLAAASTGNHDPAYCPWFSPPPPTTGMPRAAPAKPRGLSSFPLVAPFYTTPERVQNASCRHWRASGARQRGYAVRRIRLLIAGPREEGRVLPDDLARRMLTRRCASPAAREFLLYEIYARAAPWSRFGASAP